MASPWSGSVSDNVVGFRRPRLGRTRRGMPAAPAMLLAAGLALAAAFAFWPEKGETVGAMAFAMCNRPPHMNCVIDGDTFYLQRQSIRIADIDAPETHPPRCVREATLGMQATRRLRELLNAGSFELRGSRIDKYDRQLRTIYRDGRSLGAVLVSEGLARKWIGRREPWCT